MCSDSTHEHSHEDRASIHLHEHVHDGVVHRHPHYHPTTHEQEENRAAHQHAHTYAFELYSYADSSIHRLDARTKTVCFLGLIVAMVITPASEVWRFAAFFAIIAGLYALARVPLLFGIKRSLLVEPIVIMATLFLAFMPNKPHPAAYDLGFMRVQIAHGGLYIFFNAVIKSWLSVLTAILLYSTTPFPKFIKGLESMRVPGIITMLFSFLYRFMWLLTDEIKRMMRARDARAFGGGRLWHLQIIGQMIGSLFIRSYERAERVYAAMVARGYDGTMRSFDVQVLTARDAGFAALLAALVALALVWRI